MKHHILGSRKYFLASSIPYFAHSSISYLRTSFLNLCGYDVRNINCVSLRLGYAASASVIITFFTAPSSACEHSARTLGSALLRLCINWRWSCHSARCQRGCRVLDDALSAMWWRRRRFGVFGTALCSAVCGFCWCDCGALIRNQC